MKRQFISVVVLLLAISVGASAQKRAFTIEDVYRVKGVSDVRVSPDAKSVAYVLTESDLGRSSRIGHIWMMDIDGQHPRQLTFGAKGESSPRFSPDGKFLLMISSRDGAASLYLLPVAGGEAKRLTNISTGISDPLWSPDSKWIAFSTDVYPACGDDDACNQKTRDARSNGQVKGHIADSLLYRHWTDWKDGTRTHIFLAEAETGTMRDLTPGDFDSPTFQLGGPLQYDFSPDGSEIAFVSNHDKTPASSTNNDLWTLSLANRAVRPVNITASNPSYDGSPKYSPDGKYIAYRMQKLPGYESDLFRLAIYERRTGASTVLTESSFNNWVDAFEWAPDSRSIFFTGPVEGQTPIYRLDLESKRVTEVLADKTIDEFEFTRDFKRMLYVRRSTGDPVEIYSIEISNGSASTARRLTNVNAALAAEVDIRPAETMWVEGSGGSRIQVFIVKPHGFDPARKYPLILNVHGGPQQQWTDGFRGDWQVYPGAGYVVAFANPRGSTGYGQQFTAQISGDYGGAVFEDLMKVSDALEKLPYVDRNRMGAMGWSFGGYMMNWFEGHTDRFKAIASMMGVYDLRSMHGTTEELWFPQWDLKGRPWNSALYEKWSPSNYVKNFKMPALVISGERDYRVPYTQSLQFFTALQKMNVPSKLIIYSNAGHWPSWYEMALYYTAHLEWFSKYLGGEAPPWTSEEFLNNAVFDSKTGNRVVPKK